MTLGERDQRTHDGNLPTTLGGGVNIPPDLGEGANLPPDLGGGANLPSKGTTNPPSNNTNCKTALTTCSLIVGGVEAALALQPRSDDFIANVQAGQILSTFATCMNQKQFATCPIGTALNAALLIQTAARANIAGGGLIAPRPDVLPLIPEIQNQTQTQTTTQSQPQSYNPQSAQVQVQSATPQPYSSTTPTTSTTASPSTPTTSGKLKNESEICAQYLSKCVGKNPSVTKGLLQSVKSGSTSLTNLEASLNGALNTCLLANSNPCLIIGAVDKIIQS